MHFIKTEINEMMNFPDNLLFTSAYGVYFLAVISFTHQWHFYQICTHLEMRTLISKGKLIIGILDAMKLWKKILTHGNWQSISHDLQSLEIIDTALHLGLISSVKVSPEKIHDCKGYCYCFRKYFEEGGAQSWWLYQIIFFIWTVSNESGTSYYNKWGDRYETNLSCL